MKIDRLIAAVAFILAVTVSASWAQTRPAGTPTKPAATPATGTSAAPQTGTSVPEGKIALIYSEAFLDPKTGIARFNSLLGTLNREFQPRQTELQGLQQKAQQLNDEIEKTKNVAEPRTLQQKIDQLETLKKEFKRKDEDAQAAYNRRQQEIFAPLQDDIYKALEAFAKQRGITVIIDRSRVPVLFGSESIDITRAFINDFNSKNPVTASVTPPE